MIIINTVKELKFWIMFKILSENMTMNLLLEKILSKKMEIFFKKKENSMVEK